jgi:hypothetical protein
MTCLSLSPAVVLKSTVHQVLHIAKPIPILVLGQDCGRRAPLVPQNKSSQLDVGSGIKYAVRTIQIA